MQIEQLSIEGLLLLKPTIFSDERGFFMKPIIKINSKIMEYHLILNRIIAPDQNLVC